MTTDLRRTAAAMLLEAAHASLSLSIAEAHGAVALEADEGITAADPATIERYLGALVFGLAEGTDETDSVMELAAALGALTFAFRNAAQNKGGRALHRQR